MVTRSTCALLLLLTAVAPSRSDTLTVAGVVVEEGVRIKGIQVGLYVVTGGARGRSAEDITSSGGVYNLVATNLVTVDTVYIIAEDADHDGSPLKLDLGKARLEAGVKKLTAADLVLLPHVTVYDKKIAGERIAAVANVESIKMRAGVVDAKTANETVAKKAARIAAMTQTPNKEKVPLEEIWKEIKPHLDANLPGHQVLDSTNFLKLKNHSGYRPGPHGLDDSALDPAKWKSNPALLTPRVLKSLAAGDGTGIKVEWVNDKETIARLKSRIQALPGQKDRSTVAFRDPKTSTTEVIELDPSLSDESIRKLLRESPRARAWALSEKVKAHADLSNDQKRLVQDHSDVLRPTVVQDHRKKK